jgi:hypothetical protein
MREIENKYGFIFDRFLRGEISVDEFQRTFLDAFKNEDFLEEQLFELLDEVFGDIDSYTNDPQLLGENPDFYIDEASLRRKIERAATLLSEMGNNGTFVQ